MTLGNVAANHVRLIVWCKACQHQVEPDRAEMVSPHGARPCSTVAKGGPAAPPFRRSYPGSYYQNGGVARSTRQRRPFGRAILPDRFHYFLRSKEYPAAPPFRPFLEIKWLF